MQHHKIHLWTWDPAQGQCGDFVPDSLAAGWRGCGHVSPCISLVQSSPWSTWLGWAGLGCAESRQCQQAACLLCQLPAGLGHAADSSSGRYLAVCSFSELLSVCLVSLIEDHVVSDIVL